MKTIAYQGVPGAFSHMVALREFGTQNEFLGATTFKEVFDMVEAGLADCALVPIENSIVGSIYEIYDLLSTYEMSICGEHFNKIEQCLLGCPSTMPHGERMQRIRKVLSHPKALAQCTQLFHRYHWMEAIVHVDTAAAAQEVATSHDLGCAAIASAAAATIYGLDILEKGIEDDPMNYTRFVVVTKNKPSPAQANAISLLLHLPHTPGSLARLLTPFAHGGLNLTKIESRPMRGSPFAYRFYLDFAFSERTMVDQLLHELVLSGLGSVKILGFYKRGVIWTG